MRVLINALQAGNRSGTGRYVLELVKHLPGAAPDVEIGILWPEHLPRPEDTHPSAVFVPVPSATARHRIHQDQFGVRSARKSFGADIVHYPANIGPQLPVVPYVLTVHDLSFYRKPSWYRLNRAVYYYITVRRSANGARRVIADSQTTADDLNDIINVTRLKLDVAHLGVGDEFKPASEEQQAAARAKYQLPERFFLYVGTLEPRKNIPAIIEGWSLTAASSSCHLVIAGRNGWKTGPIHAAAARSPFRDRVHFPGYIEQDDLPAVLSAARAFVWPSLCEGFGMPPLESMACGVPAVSSNLSCMPEVLGDAAVLVDPYMPEEIGAALERLALDNAYHQRYSERGILRAARFTWKQTANAVLESYRRAVER